MENDPIIEAAMQDLANLEAQHQKVEEWLAQYKRYKEIASGSAETPPRTTAGMTTRKSASCDKVMSAVHDILTDRGDALTLTALFDALIARSVVIGGKNPKQNLSQKLSANPQLKSYGKRGWYFSDTIPPCLQPNVRLSDWENEEGLNTEVLRPLLTNGETGLHPA